MILGIIKGVIIGSLIIVGIIIFSFYQLSGNISSEFDNKMVGSPGFTGPTQTQIQCMETCSGCTYGDQACMQQHSARCGAECGVETSGPPESENEGEACMQKCILVGCGEYEFNCQNKNMDNCEDECNIKGDAPDESEMSAEQLCISNCVATEDPSMICGNSKEGETGGALCQKCAEECVHLYEGPCLDDAGVKEKQKECGTCEHCYGKPVMGDSGEGWECIVDVECGDASNEFGDEPGEGPGIVESIGNIFEGIGNFFSKLFGGGE